MNRWDLTWKTIKGKHVSVYRKTDSSVSLLNEAQCETFRTAATPSSPDYNLNDGTCAEQTPQEDSHVFLDLWVVVAASDQPFGGVQCVFGVGDRLAFGGHPHQTLTLCCEGNDWRRCPGSFCVLQHLDHTENSTYQKKCWTADERYVDASSEGLSRRCSCS